MPNTKTKPRPASATLRRGKQAQQRHRCDIPWTDRERVEREFEFFGTVIPTISDEPGRKRTPYFYRKMAVAFARDAREYRRSISYYVCGESFVQTLNNLAKHYLGEWRKRKGMSVVLTQQNPTAGVAA